MLAFDKNALTQPTNHLGSNSGSGSKLGWRSFCFFIGGLISVTSTSVFASEEEIASTLIMISEYAERICNKLPLEGSTKKIDLSGEAKAELRGLFKNFADVGISGGGKFADESYVGLVQEDLAETFVSNANCKERVSLRLESKLIPEVSGHTDKDTPEAAPQAAFAASVHSGQVPLVVHFSDRSEGEPAEWQWDFGDGLTSNEKNPSHTYSEPSYEYESAGANLCFREQPYVVRLTVRNIKGDDTKITDKPFLVKPKTYSLTLQPEPYSLRASAALQHLPGRSMVCPTSGSLSGVSVGSHRATESESRDEIGKYWQGQEVGLQAPHRVQSGDVTWIFRRWSGGGGLVDVPIQDGAAHHTRFRVDRSLAVTAHYERLPEE